MTIPEKQRKLLEDKAQLLKALAHPIRLCIVRNLLQSGGTNVTMMQNCLDMPQSTISQHLSKLRSAGIVEGKRSGTEITYSVINQDAASIVKSLVPELTMDE